MYNEKLQVCFGQQKQPLSERIILAFFLLFLWNNHHCARERAAFALTTYFPVLKITSWARLAGSIYILLVLITVINIFMIPPPYPECTVVCGRTSASPSILCSDSSNRPPRFSVQTLLRIWRWRRFPAEETISLTLSASVFASVKCFHFYILGRSHQYNQPVCRILLMLPESGQYGQNQAT